MPATGVLPRHCLATALAHTRKGGYRTRAKVCDVDAGAQAVDCYFRRQYIGAEELSPGVAREVLPNPFLTPLSLRATFQADQCLDIP